MGKSGGRKPATEDIVRRPAASPAIRSASPDVIVDFIFEDGLLYVALQNISDRPAYDVRVAFDRPFRGLGGEREISALALFRRMPFLAPHRAIRTLIDTTHAYFGRNEPASIVATVAYCAADGHECTFAFEHDLAVYKDLCYVLRAGAVPHA